MKHSLYNLEIHAAHGCNLHCEACTHYGDRSRDGIVPVAVAESWMRPWADRLRPTVFSILGGEPALNPDLPAFVAMTAALWPDSRLQVVSNGLILDRHPELPAVLADTGAKLAISIHHDSERYRQALEPVRALVAQWESRYRIRVEWRRSHAIWRRTYRVDGAGRMLPFADSPKGAFAACRSASCPNIFEGRLWKCPNLAYLNLPSVREGLGEEWAEVLAFTPLAPDCSEEALTTLLAKRPDPVCTMCPAKPPAFTPPCPLSQ